MTPTFLPYARTILDAREREGVRGIRSERHRLDLHLAAAGFANDTLDQIRPKIIRAWVAEMQAKKAADTRGDRLISTATVARSLSLVSVVFNRAIEADIIETNPCVGVRLRKRAEELTAAEPWTFLTLQEQYRFGSHLEIPWGDRIAIRFAVGTGLRQGEQFNLEIADVHVDGVKPHVLVRFGSKGKPPKNGKKRVVPLFGDGLAATREALAVAAAQPNPDRLLFPAKLGGRRGIGKPLGRAKDGSRWVDAWWLAKRHVDVGRRLRWHDLRHSFASNLVSGVLGRRWTLEEIRPVMGHSSITITQRYAHLGEDAIHAAARETGLVMPPLAAPTVRDLHAYGGDHVSAA